MQPVLSHGEEEDPEELRRFREAWKAEVGVHPKTTTAPGTSSSQGLAQEEHPPTVGLYHTCQIFSLTSLDRITFIP